MYVVYASLAGYSGFVLQCAGVTRAFEFLQILFFARGPPAAPAAVSLLLPSLPPGRCRATNFAASR